MIWYGLVVMSDGHKQKGKLPDHVVAPEGTSLFKTINFERYVVSDDAGPPGFPSVMVSFGKA